MPFLLPNQRRKSTEAREETEGEMIIAGKFGNQPLQ